MEDRIGFGQLVENALRGVVREALRKVAKEGLPGEHHFYITCRTQHPGVRLPTYLKEKFPDEITLVLQHQFWDLDVGDDLFAVTLFFSGKSERLVVPYAAVTGFADPSIDFGLQFKTVTEPAAVAAPQPDEAAAAQTSKAEPPASDAPKVVQLDTFRRS